MIDCPDCGVTPGTPHEFGCDIEECTSCKTQRFTCVALGLNCHDHDPIKAQWEGESSGDLGPKKE